MNEHEQLPVTCPVCAEKTHEPPLLTQSGNSLRCPKGHCFDISSKGYVNLLLSQHKNVKDPGDSKEMITARRLFLDSGAYAGLRDAVCSAVKECAAGIPSPTLIDCGCGEGYYTVGMHDAVPAMRVFGVDISKNALSAAHSRICSGGIRRDIFCAAASAFRLPFSDGCADIAAVIFAPFCREELLRVVKTGGYIITAIPAERHLYALKSLIYDKPRLNEVKPYDIAGMELTKKTEVHGEITITSQELLNALFTMTPYYYKTSPHDSSRLYSYFGTSDSFTTEIDFQVLCYRVLSE